MPEALSANPFIDAGDVTITVRGCAVTLSGTINSLIAVSMAHSLAANVDGVSRVDLRLKVSRVRPYTAPRSEP